MKHACGHDIHQTVIGLALALHGKLNEKTPLGRSTRVSSSSPPRNSYPAVPYR